MVKQWIKKNRDYFWIELAFLVFLSFAISIISDLEYNAYEEHDIAKFSDSVGYRIITGSFSLISYAIYYWGFLKRYVYSRNIAAIILCSVGFVIFDQLLDKYVSNWTVAHSSFISDSLRKQSLRILHIPRVIFTFNYRLTRSIFPLTGLAFFIRSLTQDRQMKELKEQQLLSELNYLKAQLHPHFFFNTINNIYGLALKQSAQTAPMVAKLGEMMRYILYEADQKKVLLSKEIGFLSNYIEVEKIRHQENIKIEYDVQGVRPVHKIEPLLLLPFIENAFKHGLEEETVTGYVTIVICQTERELVMDVRNSKPAVKIDGAQTGIGLQNVIKRLDILYPDKYGLEVKDNTGHYHATLTLQTA